MKHIFQTILLLVSLSGFAQTGSKNYVVTRNYKQTGAPINNVESVLVNVQYFDGLGRPVQTVGVGQSPAGRDIISPIEYDAFGRLIKKFLPYTVANGNGGFQASAATAQRAFYFTDNTAGLQGPSSNLDTAYSQTLYETAPVGRPVKQKGPGLKSTFASISYGTNTANEVKLYTYAAGTVSTTQAYPTGRLHRRKTTDENGKEVTEFVDVNGLLICRKVGTEALTTYYVYDDLKRLRAVLQPQYQEPNASLDEFAFLYDYDFRGRMISKKLPGAAAIKMVYDNFDRLVLSQDGNQAQKRWEFIKYDIFNRPILTGEKISSNDQATWQNIFNSSSAHHENKEISTIIGYTTNLTEPSVSESEIKNIIYYDDYSFNVPNNSLKYSDVYSIAKAENVKGYQTGGRTRMLTSGNNWLVSAIYYDAEYRVIQTARQTNGFTTEGYERISNKYKFDIAPIIAEQKTTQYISATESHTHSKQYTYDHGDRLVSVKEKLNLGTTPALEKEAFTQTNRYNELGTLREKWQHSDTGTEFRRKTSYTYNIRGWITDGNTEYFAKYTDTNWSPFFRYQLFYQKPGDTTKYSNGNISKVEWKGRDETIYKKGLVFSYDGADRLTSASNAGGLAYTYLETETGITYDKNGNLKTLTRGGATGNIDVLAYNYGTTTLSNKLNTITDNSGNTAGVKTGLSGTYAYDSNGNMTTDMGRGATISYNYLNLPSSIKVGTKTYEYEYDALGVKHRYLAADTIKYEGAFQYNKDNLFKRLSILDGQVILNSGALEFDYYLADHLNNVRVVYDKDGKTLQEIDYYPFGLEIDRNIPTQLPVTGTSVNRYFYNGKESQSGTGYLDYGARMYLPELGRWSVVDPMVEQLTNWSPYTFTNNNPILMIDLDGKAARYNWATRTYENDEGETITFEEAKRENGIKTVGCPPNCAHTEARADATSVAQNRVTPQYATGGVQLPQTAETILYNTDEKFRHGKQFTEYEKAVHTGIDIASMASLWGIVKNVKTATTVAKAGGWLRFHEILGHTIAKHVGKTDAELIARLASSGKIRGASTFTDMATAESVISTTISSNRTAINLWLKSNPVQNLVLDFSGSSVIGRGIMKGQAAVTNLVNARVVLKPTGTGSYNILTAFPIP